jgi:hypothetical protein
VAAIAPPQQTAVWSTELLNLLHAPLTPANYRFVNQWATREHGTVSTLYANNPFFTTAGGGGTVGPIKAGSFPTLPNTPGVARYPNLETGVYVNALHIASGYPAISAALRSGNPAAYANSASFQADLKRWSGSGYSGLSGIAAAAGPVGPTVNVGQVSQAAALASVPGGKGLGALAGDVGGAINSVARHIPGVAQAEGVVSQAEGVVSFLGKLTDPHYILRGLQILAGGVLVLVGVVLLARQVALAADLPDPLKAAGAGATAAATKNPSAAAAALE